MNRKLRNTILAFSVSGMMLALGLMAAQPLHPEAPAPAGAIVMASAPMAPAAALPGTGDARARADAAAARIDAHGRRFEAQMEKLESIEQATAAAVGFAAAVTAEAVLLETLSADADAGEDAAPAPDAAPAKTKRRGSGVRGAIAVPYFSFARGVGRGDRS